MVSGTSRAAHTAQAPAATIPIRSAWYPLASSTPLLCGGTRNAAKRNDPTASTAAISPAARTNGSPAVVAGPGSGKPGPATAPASDSAPIPAAVHPASTATPASSGHTSAGGLPADLPAGRATVMYPEYGRAPGKPLLGRRVWLSGALLTRLELAGNELIARDLLDVIEIS